MRMRKMEDFARTATSLLNMYLQSEGVCSDANFLTGLRRDLQASHSFRVSGKNTILPAPFRTALCDKISMTANKMGMDR